MMSVSESVRLPEGMPIHDKMTSPIMDILMHLFSSRLFFRFPLFVLNVISISVKILSYLILNRIMIFVFFIIFCASWRRRQEDPAIHRLSIITAVSWIIWKPSSKSMRNGLSDPTDSSGHTLRRSFIVVLIAATCKRLCPGEV